MSLWDQRYSGERYAYGTEPNDFLVEAAHHLPAGGEVLSLAEGEGRNAVFLARQGFRVTAMDGSFVGLQKAQVLASHSGVFLSTVHAELADFDMGEGRWDGIVNIWVHMPADLRRDVYRRCVRALRPGGILIVEAYTPEQLSYRTGGPPDPALLASLEELREDMEGLDFLHARETVRTIHEGDLHNGPSAVAQVVGRKSRADASPRRPA